MYSVVYEYSIFSVVSAYHLVFVMLALMIVLFFISNKLHGVLFFSFFCHITKMKTVFACIHIIWPNKRTYIATDTQNIFTMQNRYISHIFWEEEAMWISKWSPLMWELDRKREKSERTRQRRQHIEINRWNNNNNCSNVLCSKCLVCVYLRYAINCGCRPLYYWQIAAVAVIVAVVVVACNARSL